MHVLSSYSAPLSRPLLSPRAAAAATIEWTIRPPTVLARSRSAAEGGEGGRAGGTSARTRLILLPLLLLSATAIGERRRQSPPDKQ